MTMIDFGALFEQLFSSFWWLPPLLVLATLFKSPWFKGFIGETLVNLAARLFLNKNDYHLIKNVTIPAEGEIKVDANCDYLWKSEAVPLFKNYKLKNWPRNLQVEMSNCQARHQHELMSCRC
jgi:hypothetical protein